MIGNQVMALLDLRRTVSYLAGALKEKNRRLDELEGHPRPDETAEQ